MYGYKIENGEILTVPEEVKIIRKIFRNYLSGMSLTMVAKSTGLLVAHSGIKRILSRKAYVGSDNYPAIIDEDTFNKVNEIILRNMLCNPHTGKTLRRKPEVKKVFSIGKPSAQYQKPAEQAEYLYSLIQG